MLSINPYWKSPEDFLPFLKCPKQKLSLSSTKNLPARIYHLSEQLGVSVIDHRSAIFLILAVEGRAVYHLHVRVEALLYVEYVTGAYRPKTRNNK